jgi:putative glutathione S-transferase
VTAADILPDAVPTDATGAFVRAESRFRRWVTPTGESGFPAARGRYHLYVALNCPWAHRTLIFRKLKKLEDVIGLSIVLPERTERGWAFGDDPGCIPDTANGFRYLREAYERAEPSYDGRVTVPVLWDKEKKTIVNNESSEIIRMMNDAFGAFTRDDTDYYPEPERPEIERINAFVYEKVNNGVYRAGFAKSQAAYDAAFDDVFLGLDTLEERLSRQRYLAGDRVTEADWRLFPTLVRFDTAYHGAFKCNKRRLVDYPNLWAYTRELYQMPGVAETVNIAHIKRGYWRKSERNPTGIIPKGPEIDFTRPHDRDRLPARPPARLSEHRCS